MKTIYKQDTYNRGLYQMLLIVKDKIAKKEEIHENS